MEGIIKSVIEGPWPLLAVVVVVVAYFLYLLLSGNLFLESRKKELLGAEFIKEKARSASERRELEHLNYLYSCLMASNGTYQDQNFRETDRLYRERDRLIEYLIKMGQRYDLPASVLITCKENTMKHLGRVARLEDDKLRFESYRNMNQ